MHTRIRIGKNPSKEGKGTYAKRPHEQAPKVSAGCNDHNAKPESGSSGERIHGSFLDLYAHAPLSQIVTGQQHSNFSDEVQLCALLRVRDRDAYSYLYDHYSRALMGEIYRIVRNQAVAEDLLQEVFIATYRKLHTYDPHKGRLFTWMLTLARNRSIDHQRCAHTRYNKGCLEVREEHSQQPAVAENLAEHRILQKHITRLHPNLRQLLELIYAQGYTHEQAAKHQNIPLGTVKSRLKKGIKQLRILCRDA